MLVVASYPTYHPLPSSTIRLPAEDRKRPPAKGSHKIARVTFLLYHPPVLPPTLSIYLALIHLSVHPTCSSVSSLGDLFKPVNTPDIPTTTNYRVLLHPPISTFIRVPFPTNLHIFNLRHFIFADTIVHARIEVSKGVKNRKLQYSFAFPIIEKLESRSSLLTIRSNLTWSGRNAK